uniref:Uncharacterized protein n=1 Tax=Anopheles minimus TaxID=112268 RepID=A0A182WHR3_9DIPT
MADCPSMWHHRDVTENLREPAGQYSHLLAFSNCSENSATEIRPTAEMPAGDDTWRASHQAHVHVLK